MHDILLGGLQGLTEFLPVSSSAHLALAQRLLGLDDDVVARTVLFHAGTLLSCVTFFFRDIIAALRTRRLLGYIVAATCITSALGLLLRKLLDPLFASPLWIGLFLLINGALLLTTRRTARQDRPIGLKDSCLMGLAQAIAVLPGISRSGITITTLLLRGCDREEAFRFSFIASLPVVAAAFALEGLTDDVFGRVLREPAAYAGIITAYLAGLGALYALRGLLVTRRFHLFGFYCLLLGALSILTVLF
ncbi:MAG: undecaprenyl-diphosphate phosphatase [Deltaproteobacteria bacterium]